MRKQNEARKQSPGSNSGTKGKCKTGEPRPLSLQSFFFPLTRGVGVKNLDAVSFLNGATAPGR